MLPEIYDPCLRSLRWNTLLLLGICTQDVFAAVDSVELAGVIAAGIIGLFLLTSVIIAMLFFCKRIKENRKKQITRTLIENKLPGSLYQPQSGSVLNHPVITNYVPTIANEETYMETANSIYNKPTRNPNLLLPMSQSKSLYEGRLSISSKGTYRKEFDQRNERITNYYVTQPLNAPTLQTDALVHEKIDHSRREAVTDLVANGADSQFILKKREYIPSSVGKNKLNEFQELSTTEFMLGSKRERTSQRSDLRYITNDNDNTYSLRNSERFLTVGDRQEDGYPVPDYDLSEKEQPQIPERMEYNTHGYSMDLQEIKKSYSSYVPGRSYEGNWYDSYSKQVQFNSTPENIATSDVSLRL